MVEFSLFPSDLETREVGLPIIIIGKNMLMDAYRQLYDSFKGIPRYYDLLVLIGPSNQSGQVNFIDGYAIWKQNDFDLPFDPNGALVDSILKSCAEALPEGHEIICLGGIAISTNGAKGLLNKLPLITAMEITDSGPKGHYDCRLPSFYYRPFGLDIRTIPEQNINYY